MKIRDRINDIDPQKVLLRFMQHGLGDAVMFRIVIKHLKHYFPNWSLDVECRKGFADCFRDLVDNVYPLRYPWEPNKADGYTIKEYIPFEQSEFLWPDVPSTKPTQCLYNWGLTPIEDLYDYDCVVSADQRQAAEAFMQSLPGLKILLHFQGTSRPEEKSFDLEDQKEFLEAIKEQMEGYTPVLLDWSGSNPLIDNENVHCPEFLRGKTDAGILVALAEYASAALMIDSGPAHVVASVKHLPLNVMWMGTCADECFDCPNQPTLRHIFVTHHPDEYKNTYFLEHSNKAILHDDCTFHDIVDVLKLQTWNPETKEYIDQPLPKDAWQVSF